MWCIGLVSPATGSVVEGSTFEKRKMKEIESSRSLKFEKKQKELKQEEFIELDGLESPLVKEELEVVEKEKEN